MRGFIYADDNFFPGDRLGLIKGIAALSGLSSAALMYSASQVSAQTTPGVGGFQDYFDPDVEMLEAILREAMDHIMAEPNIYSSFDYQVFMDQLLGTTVGMYLVMAIGVVYLFSLILVVFRSRKNDPVR